MKTLAPIALFVYNRPEHTRRTLRFLAMNQLAVESRLFIFSDGAKNGGDEDRVNEVRALARGAEGFRSVELIERPKNFGLAESIIHGVTELVKKYGKIIVFEDDLVSSPYTLRYFNDALELYKDTGKVMHIAAYMYPLKAAGLPETFFYRAASSWGWATWERAWNHFEPDIGKLVARFDNERIKRFSIDGTMNFWKQVQEFRNRRNNSWAIRWYASVFLAGGLTLNPAKSLINNIGHDGTGVHSGVNDIYQVTVSEAPVTSFPTVIAEHPEAYAAIKSFLRTRKGSLWDRAVRFLREKMVRAGR
ncbi:sugar transferase [Hufsiella ginkgonis]|uniref:Sugar transferase n=1 Tax=Hufsiella ginkgonis TaxID=2695274 RepID=A0A7K1Y318_9SPHI|nr:sugar transferase [Hufsiella ginkgonis]MXV17498.1 sugar transferase [Hufsiella ginkgonis]